MNRCKALIDQSIPCAFLLFFILLTSQSPAQTAPVTALAFATDGHAVLAASQTGLRYYTWPTLELQKTLELDLECVHDLAFSPDGRHLAVSGGAASEFGSVQIRKWPSLETIAQNKAHDDVVYNVAWSHDGQSLVTASWDGSCYTLSFSEHARRADSSQLEIVTRYKGHTGPVLSVVNLDENLVVSAGSDQTLQVWNRSSGAAVRTLHNHTAPVHALSTAPQVGHPARSLLASAGEDRTVRFWQPSIGRMVRFKKFPSVPRAIAWAPSGKELIVALDDGGLAMLDWQNLETRILKTDSSLATSTLKDTPDRTYELITSPDAANIVFSQGPAVHTLNLLPDNNTVVQPAGRK